MLLPPSLNFLSLWFLFLKSRRRRCLLFEDLEEDDELSSSLEEDEGEEEEGEEGDLLLFFLSLSLSLFPRWRGGEGLGDLFLLGLGDLLSRLLLGATSLCEE